MKRLLVPVMLLLGAAPAFAQPNATLAPEVQQKVDAARDKFRAQAKPIFEDLRATRQSLRDELAKAQPDDRTLVQLEDRLASDRQQMMAMRAAKQAELKKQLSPKEYAQLMLSHAGRFGRRGMRHHRGE